MAEWSPGPAPGERVCGHLLEDEPQRLCDHRECQGPVDVRAKHFAFTRNRFGVWADSRYPNVSDEPPPRVPRPPLHR